MPHTDPNEDDDDTTTNKVQAKLDKLAHKPCEYWHVFVAFCLGFIVCGWLF